MVVVGEKVRTREGAGGKGKSEKGIQETTQDLGVGSTQRGEKCPRPSVEGKKGECEATTLA